VNGLFLTLLLPLLPSAAPAAGIACQDSYMPRYNDDWGLERKTWEVRCRQGKTPLEILEEAQTLSIKACWKRYYAPVRKEEMLPATLKAYCSQGASGRARLSQLTGIQETADLPPAPPAPEEPPPPEMGPLPDALRRARSGFDPEACWSGFAYRRQRTAFIPKSEYDRQRREGGYPLREGENTLQAYRFFFTRPGTEEMVEFLYGDRIDKAFCHKVDPIVGPDSHRRKGIQGASSCLANVNIDVAKAVQTARDNGLPGSDWYAVFLGRFPPGYFRSGRCAVKTGFQLGSAPTGHLDPLKAGMTLDSSCSDVWPRNKTRRLEGKEVYVIAAEGRTAFVGAKKGRFRFVGEGVFNPQDDIWPSVPVCPFKEER